MCIKSAGWGQRALLAPSTQKSGGGNCPLALPVPRSMAVAKVGVWFFRPFAGSPPGLYDPWLSPPYLGRFAPVEYR